MHFYSKSFFKYLFMVKTSEKHSLPYKFTLTRMLEETFTYLCPLKWIYLVSIQYTVILLSKVN